MMEAVPNRNAPKLGAKVRALRRQEGLSQVQMAERLAISPSYLNLIEANKRPLTATLLINLAHAFKVDLKTFAPQEDQRMAEDLMEAFGDGLFEALDLPASEVRDLAQGCPSLARAVFLLYQSYREARRRMETLSDQLSDGQGFPAASTPLPSEAAGDFIQRRMNYFPELEEAAEARDVYLRTLSTIVEAGILGNVSLKLTQLGLDFSYDECLANMEQLAACAARLRTFVRIDMEASAYTDRTLRLARALHARGHRVVFFEKDVEWYASNRDLPQPGFVWQSGRTRIMRWLQKADELARDWTPSDSLFLEYQKSH